MPVSIDQHSLTPSQALQKYFGYDSFRPIQAQIIAAILNHQDTIATLPTGGGKSICFQIPGLLFTHPTLVISPLISLMADQVAHLTSQKIPAVALTSQLSPTAQPLIISQILAHQFKFVYLSPEKLCSPRTLTWLSRISWSQIVIDEAHCLSLWGPDFRPSYLQLGTIISQLHPRPVISAFTATATPAVLADISHYLVLVQPTVINTPPLRQNLALIRINCASVNQKKLAILKILRQHLGQAGLIYAATRGAVAKLAAQLNHWNWRHQLSLTPIEFYHAGLTNELRHQVQTHYLNHQTQIICATNAFGMGVDKADIRFVIHYQLPANLENYFQEIGRAGRDQQPSWCYLLNFAGDGQIQAEMIKGSTSPASSHLPTPQTQINLTKLQQMIHFVTTHRCLNQILADHFSYRLIGRCQRCSNCLPDLKLRLTKVEGKRHRQWQKLGCQLARQMSLTETKPTNLLSRITLDYLTILNPLTAPQRALIPGWGIGLEKLFEQLTHR